MSTQMSSQAATPCRPIGALVDRGQRGRTNPASIFPISILAVPLVTAGSRAAKARSHMRRAIRSAHKRTPERALSDRSAVSEQWTISLPLLRCARYPPGVPDGWPLIGRGAERDEISSLIHAGRGVVLAGPPGVGKSRLLDDTSAALEHDGWRVERVVGTPAISALPLAAFAFVDEPATMELGRFPTPLGSVRRVLLDGCGGRRLLLAIDDAHFLDDTSAGLVYQLAVAGDAVVAATVRSTERSPEAVIALWKDEHCERIELQSLARREIDQLVEAVLGGRVDAETRRALWDATQGNLLFLRELIRDGLRNGSLHEDGLWRWRKPRRPPASVRELIGRQVDLLPADARRALDLVAQAEPLEWALLTAIVPEEVVDALVDEGYLFAKSDRDRLVARVSHPLVADVLRDSATEVRRRRLFIDLVDALPPAAQRRTDLLRRVTWLVDAGRDVGSDDLVDAARRTMLHDPRRAESLARLALEQGAGRRADVVLAQILMFGNRAHAKPKIISPGSRLR